MEHQEIAAGFDKLAPWVTRFTFDGNTYGGEYDAAHDSTNRIGQFTTAFPDVETILELGSLEGGHTLALANLPGVQRVLGIEGRAANVERALFALEAGGAVNASVMEADLETLDLAQLGRFDVVFNCGLLYHLPEPWELLARIAAVTDQMFLSTHYHPKPESTAGSYRGGWHEEYGVEDPLSGLSASSFWPTRDSLIEMLATTGFGRTEVTFDDPGFQNGPLICIAARRV